MRVPRDRGTFLVEAMVALALGGILLTAFTGVLLTSVRGMRSVWDRAEALEVVRTIWVVLDEELGAGIPDRDWSVDGEGGVVSLRAFRGFGRVCVSEPTAQGWSVAARVRRPAEVGRDSLLVLGTDGGWRAFALEGVVGSGGCPVEAGEISQRWRWQQDGAPRPLLARLFERGEYHLTEGALRYRRGAGGRQPLTPERLGEGSALRRGWAGWEVHLEWRGRAPGEFTWTILGSEDSGTPAVGTP